MNIFVISTNQIIVNTLIDILDESQGFYVSTFPDSQSCYQTVSQTGTYQNNLFILDISSHYIYPRLKQLGKILLMGKSFVLPDLFCCLKEKCSGYLILNETLIDSLSTILLSVVQGGVYFGEEAHEYISTSLVSYPQVFNLKPQEIEILKLFEKGLNNAEVAQACNYNVNWFRNSVLKKIFTKLKVINLQQALIVAAKAGLVGDYLFDLNFNYR